MLFYTLMLRNQPVMELKFDKGHVFDIVRIYNESCIPLHLQNHLDTGQVDKWLESRLVPHSRQMYTASDRKLKQSVRMGMRAIAFHNHMLSLSDQYWLRDENISAEWEDINFFTNPFDYDVGNILFDEDKTAPSISLRTPDTVTNGICLKSWRMSKNGRCLIKAGMEKKGQEPVNEVAVSNFLSANHFPHLIPAKYSLTKIRGRLCSVSENFLTERTELVTAYSVFHYEDKPDGKTSYSHLRDMCRKLEIPDADRFMDAMLLFDNIIANKDRHMGNFGFLRDTKTMKFLGPAPLFDSGSSLWFDEILIGPGGSVMDEIAKPFGKLHRDNLKEIRDTSFIRKMNVKELKHALKDAAGCAGFDKTQIGYICDNVESRYERIYGEIERKQEMGIEEER